MPEDKKFTTPSGVEITTNEAGAITGEALTPTPGLDVQQPETSQPFNLNNVDFSGFMTPPLQETPQESQAQAESERLRQLNLQALGEEERRSELEEQADLTGLLKTEQEFANQLKIVQAEQFALSEQARIIPLQLQEEAAGRGVTAGGLRPLQTARLRQLSIRQGMVASKGLMTAANLAASRDNIALATQLVDRAVAQEFDPIKKEIEARTANLNLVLQSPAFTREQQNRAQEQKDIQTAKMFFVEQQVANRKEVFNIGLTAQKFGAPLDVVQQAFASETPEDALLTVGKFIQDPQAKIEMQNAILAGELAKVQVERQKEELSVYRRYGGLTPAQWIALKKTEEKERQDQIEKNTKDLEEAEVKRIENRDELKKVDDLTIQVNSILDSPALDSVVGPTPFTRSITRTAGFFPQVLALGGIGGLIDETTGKADDTIALTEQLISQQFLDKLIEVKGQGATFGALSDREGNSLRSAANAIGAAKIENRQGKTIGYDMSEKEFKNQMNIMLEALEIARNDIATETLSEDDPISDLINSAYGDIDLLRFNPSF